MLQNYYDTTVLKILCWLVDFYVGSTPMLTNTNDLLFSWAALLLVFTFNLYIDPRISLAQCLMFDLATSVYVSSVIKSNKPQ